MPSGAYVDNARYPTSVHGAMYLKGAESQARAWFQEKGSACGIRRREANLPLGFSQDERKKNGGKHDFGKVPDR
jgi:hypothetical protein